jgi:hypothetical protein
MSGSCRNCCGDIAETKVGQNDYEMEIMMDLVANRSGLS